MCDELKKKAKIGIEVTFSNTDFDLLKVIDPNNENDANYYDENKKHIVGRCLHYEGLANEKGFVISSKESEYEKRKQELNIIDPKLVYIYFIKSKYLSEWKKEIEKITIDGFKISSDKCDDVLKGFENLKYFDDGEGGKKKKKDKEYFKGFRATQIRVNVTKIMPNKKIKSDLIWHFNIDTDEKCIEIHAKELTLEQYIELKDVITKLIFNIAQGPLKLKSGYGGRGGGHLSVDMMTGFGNSHINVIKTLLLFEIMQAEIDMCYDMVDVLDNVNAPYFFDSSRDEFSGLCGREIVDYDLNKLNNIKFPKKNLKNKFPNYKRNKQCYGNIRKSFILILTENVLVPGKALNNLGIALKKTMTESQQDETVCNDVSNSPLHYQAINLEHIADTGGKSRVEFRRFVSQRSHGELITAMEFLLELIESANHVRRKELIRMLKYGRFFSAIVQQNSMNVIRKRAEELAKKES